MHQIFVFTAGNKEARTHLQDSILKPVSFSKLALSKDPLLSKNTALTLGGKKDFYAWGAVPGQRNPTTWSAMVPGDYVLTVYDNEYHFISRVITKFHSPEVAKAIWGIDPTGQTWEYMYLLTTPTSIQKNVGLINDLNKAYRGFTKISDAKIASIYSKYNSIEEFLNQQFNCNITSTLPQNVIQNNEIQQAENIEDEKTYDPKDMADGRKKVITEIVRRQGQPKFRKAVLKAYSNTCAITQTTVESVLEAAHITPYLGEETNHISNGILLRADIHTLYDLKLIRININGTIHVSEELLKTEYAQYHNQKINYPSDKTFWPSPKALKAHFDS
ncbi:HNH endonuclease [Neisseriaceae bacterium CLB008]